MFNKKEVISILIAALVLGYLSSFKTLTWIGWLAAAGLALAVLFVHHLGQKFTALFYDCSTESSLWTVRQYSFKKSGHFKFDFPMWAALPIFLVWITSIAASPLKWLAITTFDATPLPSRVHRKYAELTDWDLALIAAGGLFFNALLAIVSQLLGWNSFAMLNVYFMIFNLIPFSNLDGGKIFFGSVMLWIFCIVFSVLLLFLLGSSMLANVIVAVVIALIAVILYYVSMNK